MKKYIEYSALIYKIYLKYISKKDTHVYSIDEAFLDVTSYLKMYEISPVDLANKILKYIYSSIGITGAVGIGENLYLSKVALDIIAKHDKSNIAFLNEQIYKEKLWHYTPISDFWQIGLDIEKRLHKLHLKDMYDIAHADEKILYKKFGVNARYLIDHSKQIELVTISEIKSYKPKSKSISNSQILYENYSSKKARNVLIEMIDLFVLQLVSKNLCTKNIGFYIGYSNDVIPGIKVSKKLEQPTSSYRKILNTLLLEYDYQVRENVKIRRISILAIIEEKRILEQDSIRRLNLKISKLKRGDNVTIKYIMNRIYRDN